MTNLLGFDIDERLLMDNPIRFDKPILNIRYSIRDTHIHRDNTHKDKSVCVCVCV